MTQAAIHTHGLNRSDGYAERRLFASQQGDGRPQLLVSIRSECEAARLMSCDTLPDVIDAKEPGRGAMGPVDRATLAAIVQRVATIRPVTAAAGELYALATDEFVENYDDLPLAAVKVGLARASAIDWRRGLEQLRDAMSHDVFILPVAYADHRFAGGPDPAEVIRYAASTYLPGVVVDTYEKATRDVIDIAGGNLNKWLASARRSDIRIGIAGRLTAERAASPELQSADWIGFRGAVCTGERTSALSPQAVEQLVARLSSIAAKT